MAVNYRIGTGIYDVTGPAAELGMMGMANIDQKTEGIQSRLFARAFIIHDDESNKRVVILSADIWSCTIAVKTEVIKRLKSEFGSDLYTLDNVMLSGTHTHSGPGGYSHYALYNMTILGFDEQNFECIVNGMVQAIKRAHNNLAPGKIFINKGEIEDCGRNRSPIAYNNNPEAERNKYEHNTDKEMLLLKFVKENGKEIGCINWYAIHPTNRGNSNKLISGDNKGYASYLFEREMGTDIHEDETFIAAFANSNCGDVSGNIKYGVPDLIHDFVRMKEYGDKQYEKARELYDNADEEITGPVDFRHTYVDMSNVEIEGTGSRTWPAALGASMFAGSTEDSKSEYGLKEGILATDTGEYPVEDRPAILKAISLLSGILADFEFPGILDEDLKKGHAPKPIAFVPGKSKPHPLSPPVLPLQVLRIGNTAIAALPGEMTTMAGRRLKQTVLEVLKNSGVDYSLLTAYANGYSGYTTTKEEYDMQHYEGASTHFGPHSLAAYQQEFKKLAEAMGDNKLVHPGLVPEDLSDKQNTLQSGVITDTQPLPWISFGTVERSADLFYRAGNTAKVVFWGAHPKNDLRTQKTFLEVQRKEGNKWETIFTDLDPCTVYKWERDFVANSKITIKWYIPADTAPGEYRIKQYGNNKDIAGKIHSYEGTSNVFKVGEKIATDEIVFKNSFGKEVQIWFYHPNDWLKWVAYSKKTLKAGEKFKWNLPSGWGSTQVRFTEPDKWRTIFGGESIDITSTGEIVDIN